MTNAIVATASTDLITFSDDQVGLIKRTIANDATDDELALFLHQAQKTGLDPLARQIHFQKYNTKSGPKIAIITGIDGYRLVADRTGKYAGSDEPVFEGRIEGKYPAKATVTVWKLVANQRMPFSASVYWEEYYPGDKKGFQWRKMPHVMLAKCAEAAALRKAFPADLSGVYTSDEMQQADFIEGEVLDKEPNWNEVQGSPQYHDKSAHMTDDVELFPNASDTAEAQAQANAGAELDQFVERELKKHKGRVGTVKGKPKTTTAEKVAEALAKENAHALGADYNEPESNGVDWREKVAEGRNQTLGTVASIVVNAEPHYKATAHVHNALAQFSWPEGVNNLDANGKPPLNMRLTNDGALQIYDWLLARVGEEAGD
jgi:phage recombination protein Bet